MNIPTNILTMLAGIVLTLVSVWYGQNHGLMPVQASQEASLVDGLFDTMMTASVAIFLLVEGVLVICLFKFRRRPGDETDGPPIEGNIPLEIVWTAIPVVIVLVIGVYSFDVYSAMGGFDPEAASDPGVVQVAMVTDGSGNSPSPTQLMDPPKLNHHHHMALGLGASPETAGNAPDLTVNVLGMQYAWIFTYPDAGVTSGELHIPVNKDVKLSLKAQDVIHAFWLPEFRIKQDTMPGQDSELRFIPTRIGDYPIVCAELCGPYHGGMITRLYVHSQEDYDSWLQTQVAAKESGEAIALQPDRHPENLADAEFLAPYADQLGIDPQLVKHIHPMAMPG